jgi:peroxiredoxin
MKTVRKYFVVVFLVLLGVAGFFLFKNVTPFDRQKPEIGEFAPALSLADLSGGTVRLSDFKGKVVLLNFWASWCPPCRDELPGFQRVYLAYHDKGFAVIAVAIDEITPSVVNELGFIFPVVTVNERVSRDYGNIGSIPVSFLIGKDGRIIRKVKGVYFEADVRRDVERELKR